MARVSVVVPTYNHARYLPEAIASVLGQTWSDLDLVVVDDGSTDNTRDVIGVFTDNRIRYVYQENRGLAAARNTGLRNAGGQYVALLDADDIWGPTFLHKAMAALEADPTADAAYTGFQFMDENGQRLYNKTVNAVPPERFHDQLVSECWIVPSSVVARRTCYEATGDFDTTLRACEDYDMWLRMSKQFRFVGIPEPLVKYRRTGSNMTDDVPRMFTSLMRVAEKHMGPPEGLPDAWPVAKRVMYSNAHRYAVDGYASKRDIRQAADHLQAALTIHPGVASDVVLWYRLGCAHQPWEVRGAWSTMDVEQAKDDVCALLDEVWDRTDLPSQVQKVHKAARGHGYLALGLLAYGCRRFGSARSFLLMAVSVHSPIVRDRRWFVTLAKACVGPFVLPQRPGRAPKRRDMNDRGPGEV